LQNLKKIFLLIIILLLLYVFQADVMFAADFGCRVLKYGTSGNDVVELQQKLISLGFLSGKADGVFGSKTKTAVKKFQSSRGLKSDGIVGQKTFMALKRNSTSRGTVGRYSQRDVELLAKLVYAEARGEPYLGQVGVAAVVLNRVNDPNYPNTIPEVIFQVVDGRYQFSPVANGQINLTPDNTARNAAIDAILGKDPVYGAKVFYNPDKTNDRWVSLRSCVVKIGKHVFCK